MAAPPQLPDIATLPSQPAAVITAALDALFEPEPALHALVLPRLQSSPAFDSYDALADHVGAVLLALAVPDAPAEVKLTLHGILGAHPRLGAARVDSAQSAAEQARLQAASAEEAAQLAALNAEYEAAFPGLRYVVFVNGRGRPEIMANMRERIARGDFAAEEREAIQVCPPCRIGLILPSGC